MDLGMQTATDLDGLIREGEQERHELTALFANA
jgi:hypothetical protein